MADSGSFDETQLSLEDIWSDLEKELSHYYIQSPEIEIERFTNLCSRVHNYCTLVSNSSDSGSGVVGGGSHNRAGTCSTDIDGSGLYNKLKDFFKHIVNGMLEEGKDLHEEKLLMYYRRVWWRFRMASCHTTFICYDLNTNWIKRQIDEGDDNIFEIFMLAMATWRKHLFEEIHENLTIAVLKLIERERWGERISTDLIDAVMQGYLMFRVIEIKGVSGSRVARGAKKPRLFSYLENFEELLLKDTQAFYTKKVNEFFVANNHVRVTEYMYKVNGWMKEEERRCERYLHHSTKESLGKTCRKVLIAQHLELFKKEFSSLLVAGKDEELALMYSLIRSVDDELGALRNMLEKHIEKQGALAIERCSETAVNDPKIYVHTILEVHRRYSALVERSFKNEPGFVQALDKACAAFVNKNNVTIIAENTSKSAELLARYCDWLLKKGAKNSNEAELKNLLTQAMVIFKYIEDKDIFEKFYSNMLAKRLISSLSVNDDAESSMISKLKEMCGCDYTSRLQRMLTETHSSKELNEAFQEHERNASTSLNLDFSIVVFNSGVWPLRQTFTFEIPSELVSCIGRFTDFYNHRYNGRKLTWLPTLSKGELITNCFQKKYTFTASTVQMALLLMFNESVEYTIGTLVDNLKLKKEVLVQVVLALVKIQLLEFVGGDSDRKLSSKESSSSTEKGLKGETPDLPGDTIIRLNTSFSRKLKVDLSKTVPRTVVRQEQEQVLKSIEEDRKILVQAAIVRIMKMRKQLKHQQLMVEVLEQLSSRFQPKVPMIKKCIELLIDKEYLQRVEGETDLYTYLA